MNVSLVLRLNERGAIGPAGQSFSYERTCEIMIDNAVRALKNARGTSA